MGATTQTSSRVVLTAASSATQISTAKCTITCDQTLSNNTVIIDTGSTVGNINFENICVIIDSTCMINQNISTSILNILNASIDQTALATQPLFSLVYNSTKASSSLDEVVSNQIQQLINSQCTIATNQEMNNNYIYVGSGTTVGDISFVQHSTLSNVECLMDISAKADVTNRLDAKVKQTAATIDTTFLIVIVIVLILLVIGGIAFIFIIRRVIGNAPPKAAVPATAIPVAKAVPLGTAVPVATTTTSTIATVDAIKPPPLPTTKPTIYG